MVIIDLVFQNIKVVILNNTFIQHILCKVYKISIVQDYLNNNCSPSRTREKGGSGVLMILCIINMRLTFVYMLV